MFKLIIPIVFFVFHSLFSSAQQENFESAKNKLNSKDLDAARYFIEKAITNEKTKDKPETWYYRGAIYEAILFDTLHKADDYKKYALYSAYESFMKSLKLGGLETALEEDAKAHLKTLQPKLTENGISNFYLKRYEVADKYLEASVDAATYLKQFDSVAIYMIGYNKIFIKDYDQAEKYLQKSIVNGYKPKDSYQSLVYLKNEAGDYDAAQKYIDTGLNKFPNSTVFMQSKVALLYETEGADSTLKWINNKIDENPKKPIYYFARASYLTSINDSSAVDDFEKAIELNPKFEEAQYSLGAYYFNKAASMFEKMNKASEEQKEAMRKEMKKYFKKAKPYFEKALELNPSNEVTQRSLRTIDKVLKEEVDERSDQ